MFVCRKVPTLCVFCRSVIVGGKIKHQYERMKLMEKHTDNEKLRDEGLRRKVTFRLRTELRRPNLTTVSDAKWRTARDEKWIADYYDTIEDGKSEEQAIEDLTDKIRVLYVN